MISLGGEGDSIEGSSGGNPVSETHDGTVPTGPTHDIDVAVVGAGQAGVMLSRYLQQREISHIVLERDRPLSSWHGRWEGFRTNTPNWMNTLPVLPKSRVPSDDRLAFATRQEIIQYLEECVTAIDPPLRTGREVRQISPRGQGWDVYADGATYRVGCVALCNGAMSNPRIPDRAREIDPSVAQIHSSDYQRPEQIGTGSVLVVGSASSGVQICRLLCESGRFEDIHMSVSNVMVLPERVLGIQTHRLLHVFRLFDVRSRSLLGRIMYSGLETKGDPIMRPAPHDLAKTHGVTLYSRFDGVDGSKLTFTDGETLDTEDLTIIWCTGFRGDYSMLDGISRDVLDARGAPIHDRGVATGAPGLFFVGLRHQYTVASHDIYGVSQDAEFIAGRIEERLRTISESRAPSGRPQPDEATR